MSTTVTMQIHFISMTDRLTHRPAEAINSRRSFFEVVVCGDVQADAVNELTLRGSHWQAACAVSTADH